MNPTTLDTLEIEHGTAILANLCGVPLTRNQQPVRLFDETRKSAEYYFKSDKRSKPYVQDFQNGRRFYPVTAYAESYKLDFNTALSALCQQYNNATTRPNRTRPTKPPGTVQQIDYLPIDYYQQFQTGFERNGLYEYLRFTYGRKSADEVVSRYRLGTSRQWQYEGYLATCLPQFDRDGNLRQVKVMPFDAMNGRRVKNHQQADVWHSQRSQYEPTAPGSSKIFFAGKRLAKAVGLTDVHLKQCFFGEHLLTDWPDKLVGIVEGETTAIVCSLYWPQFIWLATGGSSGAGWSNPATFNVLRGRDVTLWPDTGKYAEWSEKADVLRPLVNSLNVSDYVDRNAPAGMGNVDLRDLLTRPRWFPSAEDSPLYNDKPEYEPNYIYPANLPRPP